MKEEILFEGWVARFKQRSLDRDKQPIDKWKYSGYQIAGRGLRNPYLYTSEARAKGANKRPIYYIRFDYSTAPSLNNFATREEFLAEYRRWQEDYGILGYYENEVEVKKASVVLVGGV